MGGNAGVDVTNASHVAVDEVTDDGVGDNAVVVASTEVTVRPPDNIPMIDDASSILLHDDDNGGVDVRLTDVGVLVPDLRGPNTGTTVETGRFIDVRALLISAAPTVEPWRGNDDGNGAAPLILDDGECLARAAKSAATLPPVDDADDRETVRPIPYGDCSRYTMINSS